MLPEKVDLLALGKIQLLVTSGHDNLLFLSRRLSSTCLAAGPRSAIEHEQYVLGGRAKVGIGDRVYEVEKGDVVFIPAGEPHWYEAYGEEPFELLSVLPNKDNEVVFAK